VHDPATDQQAVPPAGTVPTKAGAADVAAQQKQADSYQEPGTKHLVDEEKKKPGNFMVVPQIEATFTLGETSKFAGSFGIAGFGVDARYMAFRPWRFGASISWQTISQRREDSVESAQAAYSGTMIKELSYNPILAKVGYTLSETDTLRSFAAVGVGGARSLRRIDTGIVSLTDEQWHFSLAGELGLEIPLGPIHVVGTGRLSYLAPSGGIGDQVLINLCLGVGFD
jgi:hypothetical protein